MVGGKPYIPYHSKEAQMAHFGRPPYDPEAGGMSAGAGGAARSVRRVLASRRARLVLAALTVTGIMIYMAAPAEYLPRRGGVQGSSGLGKGPLGAKNIWEGDPYDSPRPQRIDGVVNEGGVDVTRPQGGQQAAPLIQDFSTARFVVDEYGDRYLPDVMGAITPMHPAPEDLLDAADFFPEVDIDTFLQPPVTKPFPDSDLPLIVSEAPVGNEPYTTSLPADSFSQTWEAPEDWNEPGPGVKPLQWSGFANPGSWETKEEAAVRESRRQAVKRGFVYAWQKYKDKAWGHDEVRPKSEMASDPFNNWGASIVDTLDTLLLLGLNDEYNLCRPHVNQIKFQWVKGKDWSQGYIAPEGTTDKDGWRWEVPRDRSASIPVFETGIRYLGGMLGAYDLSGDKLLLERAIELAEILKKAFNTKSGLPQGSRFDPGLESGIYQLGGVSIAEVGSMTLELMRLSQHTGDRQWFDLAQRVTDFIEQKVAPRTIAPPLIPQHFIPDQPMGKQIAGTYSMGAMTDSYYEYLIKTYKLLGGGALAQQYRRLYEGSMDIVRRMLYVNIDTIPGRDLFTIGKLQRGQLSYETEHLACFAGAMLGLGAKLLDLEQDMVDAQRFTQTCTWIAAAGPLGIQPEVAYFFQPTDKMQHLNVTTDGLLYHPPVKFPIDPNESYYSKMRKNAKGELVWKDDQTPVSDNSGRNNGQPISYYSKLAGRPHGIKRATGYYINRPETIESVFYMYRMTGDRKWQEKGWRMFTSWMTHAKVDGGISSIRDVTQPKPTHGDNMESFIFAETFKYHYLLQSEPDLLNLDDYVLNTEAHPFIASNNKDMKPGSAGLWTPPPEGDTKLGERGAGTDAQKWMRMAEMARFHRTPPRDPKKPPPVNKLPGQGRTDGRGGGGGRGMGGGGWPGGRGG